MNDFFDKLGKGGDFMDIFDSFFGDKVNPIAPSEKIKADKPKYATTQKPKNRKFNSEKTNDGSLVLRVPVTPLTSVHDLSLKFDAEINSFYVFGQAVDGHIEKEFKINKQIEKIINCGIVDQKLVIRFYVKQSSSIPIYMEI